MMKKSRASRSAYTHFRVFLASTLCLAGLSLAVTAFGAWPALVVATSLASQKNQTARDAKTKAENIKRAAALKNIKAVRSAAAKSQVGGAAVPLDPTAQTPIDPSRPSTVKQHTNALGQTVHVI